MQKVVKVGVRTLRAVVGENSTVERRLRHVVRGRRALRARTERGDGWVRTTGQKFVHLDVASDQRPPLGVFLRGGCDVPSLFLVPPLMGATPTRSMCIYSQGIGISDSRADVLLQSLRGVAPEHVSEVGAALDLPAEYFAPRLFEPTFTVPALPRLGAVDKDVIALSLGPSLVRTVYRHREHGYLVDPGGWWLNQSMSAVLSDLSSARWFKENFKRAGRMTVEEFHRDFGQVVTELKARTDAHILVFNALVVDPGSPTHNYQFVTNPSTLRRRAFAVALADLSRTHDVHVVDVDHAVKGAGINAQLDFGHYPLPAQQVIAKECHRILRALDII